MFFFEKSIIYGKYEENKPVEYSGYFDSRQIAIEYYENKIDKVKLCSLVSSDVINLQGDPKLIVEWLKLLEDAGLENTNKGEF